MTDKLKIKLNECQIHKGEIFCAWCDICDNNLCQLCIGEELTIKKHNFILYNSLLSKNFDMESIDSQIMNLKDKLNQIKIYYENVVEYEKEYKYLEKQINIIEFCYNLFFKQNIINYQILLNLKMNLENLQRFFEICNLMNENKYSVFLSFIKGKYIKEIKTKELDIKKIKNILILNPSLYNDENKDDSQNESQKRFMILCDNLSDLIYIYDMDGKLINMILIERRLMHFPYCMIQYQSNILLLYDYINFYFIIFSSDFNQYEVVKLEIFLQISTFKFILNKYIPICSFNYRDKIYRLSENKIALFTCNKIYVIKFNNNLIFQNKEYYNKKNKNNTDNKVNNFEIILDLGQERQKNYIDFIPIYYTGTEEKGCFHRNKDPFHIW